jgi:uncharacterized membrane protein
MAIPPEVIRKPRNSNPSEAAAIFVFAGFSGSFSEAMRKSSNIVIKILLDLMRRNCYEKSNHDANFSAIAVIKITDIPRRGKNN